MTSDEFFLLSHVFVRNGGFICPVCGQETIYSLTDPEEQKDGIGPSEVMIHSECSNCNVRIREYYRLKDFEFEHPDGGGVDASEVGKHPWIDEMMAEYKSSRDGSVVSISEDTASRITDVLEDALGKYVNKPLVREDISDALIVALNKLNIRLTEGDLD